MTETPVDRVIGVGSEYLRFALGNPDCMDLVVAAVRAVKPDGEVRIVVPVTYVFEKKAAKGKTEADLEATLLQRDVDTKVQITGGPFGERSHASYALIKPRG